MWSIVGVRDDKLQTRNVRGEVARLALASPPLGHFLVESLLPGWATKTLTRSPDHTRRGLANPRRLYKTNLLALPFYCRQYTPSQPAV